MVEILKRREREVTIETINRIHRLLEKTKPRRCSWATYKDYLEANREKGLIVVCEGKILKVTHIFPGEIVAVPTLLRTAVGYGSVLLDKYPGVAFATAFLFSFHGRPCEQRSHQLGGEGYPRIPR